MIATALLGLALVLVLERVYTYDEPLERDITTYAVVAHEALGGRALYADLWDNKSPLVYVTYGAAELVAGYGARAIFLLGVFAATATLLGVYRAAVRMTGSTGAGLWAAAFWTAVAADQGLQANQPNLEVFMNAALVWAFAEFLADRRRPLVIGALCAAASLYKLIVLPVVGLCLAGMIVVARRERELRRAIVDAGVVVGAIAVPWTAVLGYFAITGRAARFNEAVFAYNRAFAGNLASNLVTGVTAYVFPVQFRVVTGIALLSVVGVVWLTATRRRRSAALWSAYAVGTEIAVALPGKFYGHYFQLWLPVLATGAAVGVHAIARMTMRLAPPPWRRVLPVAAGAAALVAILAWELPTYGQSPDEWSRAKYRTDVFVDAKRTAPVIDAALAPGETFFQWGDETELYFYTRRHPPTGLFYGYPMLVVGPLQPELAARVVRDLERTRPELLAVNVGYLYRAMETHPVTQWLSRAYYHWAGRDNGPFQLYVRQGGALERRLNAAR